MPGVHGAVSTGQWLQHLMRLDQGEAFARVAAAEAAGPRSNPTEALAPMYEHVAAGQATGVVSARQAQVIVKTIGKLPLGVQAEHGLQIEKDLVGYAASFAPAQLRTLAQRMVDHVHPDGTRPTEEALHEGRYLHVFSHATGGARIEGELTPEATERLLTCFDVLAAPKAAVDGVKDARRPEQRQHDALCDLLETAVRTGQVPSNNGVSATVVVTMSVEQYQSGRGLARSGHGAFVPAADALTWSGGDTEVLGVVLTRMHEIAHYSHTQRIFTEHQRRAITARDRGCTFPGCDQPPGRCQTDHVIRHEHGGPTSVANGQLLCRYHHREHQKFGWRAVMINGVPHWTPPVWIDAAQTPRRNMSHDTAPSAASRCTASTPSTQQLIGEDRRQPLLVARARPAAIVDQ